MPTEGHRVSGLRHSTTGVSSSSYEELQDKFAELQAIQADTLVRVKAIIQEEQEMKKEIEDLQAKYRCIEERLRDA